MLKSVVFRLPSWMIVVWDDDCVGSGLAANASSHAGGSASGASSKEVSNVYVSPSRLSGAGPDDVCLAGLEVQPVPDRRAEFNARRQDAGNSNAIHRPSAP